MDKTIPMVSAPRYGNVRRQRVAASAMVASWRLLHDKKWPAPLLRLAEALVMCGRLPHLKTTRVLHESNPSLQVFSLDAECRAMRIWRH